MSARAAGDPDEQPLLSDIGPRRRSSVGIDTRPHDSPVDASEAKSTPGNASLKVVLLLSLGVVSFGVADRIAYKTMLVPLEQYPYFVSQVSALTYVLM
jgi:hypothetical protein